MHPEGYQEARGPGHPEAGQSCKGGQRCNRVMLGPVGHFKAFVYFEGDGGFERRSDMI